MSTLKPAVSAADHLQGSPSAPVTLVEYGDYQCPHCGSAYPVIKKVQEYFGDKLKFVFRNFPLQNIHPFAVAAAIATEAAAGQNKFWEMHDIIFENQNILDENSLAKFAGVIGINVLQFSEDCKNVILLKKVENDFESGLKSGVNGTPSFFINGIKYNGSWNGNDLIEVLNSITK